ncbi:phosphopantetheine-binding protein [Paenibacillus sp. GCM10012307]|uniref:Acyl carrier protein n=1 Tax=Paenibacillus roseus TaxID=2798579 RepID=A0A934MTC9_9BACL|nr:phosphopantetheine-binding protein [Paenibacillus roseus]MBJ6364104.1 acyl carrier protein [Paenibacillus roseus]
MSEQVQTIDFDVRFDEVLQKNLEQSVDEELLKSDLESAGLNSISFVKLIVALEHEFDVEFEDEVLIPDNFSTLEQFKESVKRFIEQRSA